MNISKNILGKYDIDPVNDLSNLMWASNVEGVHTTENAKKVALELVKADKEIGADLESGKINKKCAKSKMQTRLQSIGKSVFGGY
ncbi:Rhs-family protein [Mixta tenebrionis]|uniref:Rhs-family protein n=1 Tax=Mixta tenebrionis TaxID=2562439 RepID=UPI001FEC1CCE|nr:Rhs-family protein [Mixta tenebrionis]